MIGAPVWFTATYRGGPAAISLGMGTPQRAAPSCGLPAQADRKWGPDWTPIEGPDPTPIDKPRSVSLRGLSAMDF
jgi:hypothetical protein